MRAQRHVRVKNWPRLDAGRLGPRCRLGVRWGRLPGLAACSDAGLLGPVRGCGRRTGRRHRQPGPLERRGCREQAGQRAPHDGQLRVVGMGIVGGVVDAEKVRPNPHIHQQRQPAQPINLNRRHIRPAKTRDPPTILAGYGCGAVAALLPGCCGAFDAPVPPANAADGDAAVTITGQPPTQKAPTCPMPLPPTNTAPCCTSCVTACTAPSATKNAAWPVPPNGSPPTPPSGPRTAPPTPDSLLPAHVAGVDPGAGNAGGAWANHPAVRRGILARSRPQHATP